ncbi:CapA family protein [Amycolatopsis sp. H20-H5]|nr:CapA family protein [Amycolatopsis sp. H20-H5]MEC3980174.1 CapA family protein [Amycolatopsis sp. H20-H5]
MAEHGGRRIAFLAYTSICWPVGQAATEDSPGVAEAFALTSYQPDYRVSDVPGRPPTILTKPVPEHLGTLITDLRRARAEHDVVVVSMHWGIPGDRLADYQIEYAHAAVEAGADLVVGHGPHSVQAVEVYLGRAILYSLGNLVFDWQAMRGRHLDGLVATYTFGASPELVLTPVRRNAENDAEPLTGPEADDLLQQVARLSAERDTMVIADAGFATVNGLESHHPFVQ